MWTRLTKAALSFTAMLSGIVLTSGCAATVGNLPSVKYCTEVKITWTRTGTEGDLMVEAKNCRIPQGEVNLNPGM